METSRETERILLTPDDFNDLCRGGEVIAVLRPNHELKQTLIETYDGRYMIHQTELTSYNGRITFTRVLFDPYQNVDQLCSQSGSINSKGAERVSEPCIQEGDYFTRVLGDLLGSRA